jgi:hypothetical protein
MVQVKSQDTERLQHMNFESKSYYYDTTIAEQPQHVRSQGTPGVINARGAVVDDSI